MFIRDKYNLACGFLRRSSSYAEKSAAPGLLAVFVLFAGFIWIQSPLFAQEQPPSDIEQLRESARSEISAPDQSETEPSTTEDDDKERGNNENLLNFFVMQTTLLAVVLILHTYMGMHIIKRGIIFCDLALDQLAAFGTILAVGTGIQYGTPSSYLISMAAVTVGCILLAVIRPRNKNIPQEAAIGIIYGLALVASLLLADKFATGGTILENTLVGSMSWVSWPLVGITAGIYILLLIFHSICRNRFIRITESNEDIPYRPFWDFLFFLSQGVITILIVPVAGVLLAYGFLMIPAAIGIMFTRKWGTGLLIGWSSGFIACVAGLFFSYGTDSPYGPSLLLSMGLLFLITIVLTQSKRVEG